MRNRLADLTLTREMESRLSRRRFIEAQNDRRLAAWGNGDFRQFARPRGVVASEDRVYGSLVCTVEALPMRFAAVVRRLRLEFGNLPTGLDGFRILHLSDFHIDGRGWDSRRLWRINWRFLPVDLCVLTGDYRFKTFGPLRWRIYPRMRRILGAIRARYGVVGILGNHDCADIAIELEKLGVRMLMNEAVQAGAPDSPLWVIGVDDRTTKAATIWQAPWKRRRPGGFKLLAAHSPEIFRQAAGAGVDLYLAGHTHAGQIRLPLIGSLTHERQVPRAYTHGHWRHGPHAGLYHCGSRVFLCSRSGSAAPA